MGERERQLAELEREVAEQAREDARAAAAEAIAARFHWFEVRQWALYVLFFFALAFSAWYASEQRQALREQTCATLEREYRQATDKRDKTKKYLRDLPPEDRDDAINVAIRRNLPALEKEVEAAVPPAFCPPVKP